MIQVVSPHEFSLEHLIGHFSGKNYEEAKQSAEEWATRTGKELVAYFCQKAFKKSILVSYKENKDEQNLD